IVAKITSTASRGGERHQERLIASVEHCAKLGCDGVVAMIPFAPENEPDVISLTAQIGEACDRLGMPYIAEAEFPNAYFDSGEDYAKDWGLPYLKRSARLCAELGADIVKSNWPGSGEEFAEIVDAVSVPAGGDRRGALAGGPRHRLAGRRAGGRRPRQGRVRRLTRRPPREEGENIESRRT